MAINFEKIRNTLNDNSVVVSAAAVVVILALGYFVVRQAGLISPPVTMPTKAFFVDEEVLDQGKEEILERPIKDIPPLQNGNGKWMIVRAQCMSWGDDKDKKIAWLERYSQAAKALKEKEARGEELTQMEQDRLMNDQGLSIRSPKPGSKWFPAQSPEGEQVRAAGTPPQPAGANPEGLHFVAPK